MTDNERLHFTRLLTGQLCRQLTPREVGFCVIVYPLDAGLKMASFGTNTDYAQAADMLEQAADQLRVEGAPAQAGVH